MGKEAKVGLLVIIAGCMLYFGYHTLRGNDVFTKDNFFYAEYEDVKGLQVSSPVMLSGVSIGQVESIEMQYEKGNSILVKLRINPEIPVGDSTKAILESAGLISGMKITLDLGTGTKLLETDEKLISVYKMGVLEQMGQNTDGIKKLSSQIGNLSNEDHKLRKQFSQIIANLDTTMNNSKVVLANLNHSLSAKNGKINQLISDLSYTIKKYQSLPQSLQSTLTKTGALMDSLNQIKFVELAENINSSLQNIDVITTKLTDSTNSVGALMTQKDLYNNLNKAVVDLDFILVDFQANPSKYTSISVFGKQPENEKPIIKSISPKELSDKIELKLKREIPPMFVAKLYDLANKTVYEFDDNDYDLNKSNKTVTIVIRPEIPRGNYVLHIEWLGASSGESQNIILE